MPDFNVRSDSVNVEQIMEQIRARIREKRGVDYTEAQIRELATVKLEKFLDPRGIRSDLLEQFRRTPLPERPNYAFEDDTLFETHRGFIRFMRRLLHPFLKLLFNPNPLIQALHIQSKLNTMNAEREAAFDQLYFELVHNLVLEITRLGVEVKNLKMRVESLGSRVEFNERRARALESVVVYKPNTEGESVQAARPAATVVPRNPSGSWQGRSQGSQGSRGGPQPLQSDSAGTPSIAGDAPPAATALGPVAGSGPDLPTTPGQGAEGPGQRSRRRRRRRGRRGGGSAVAVMGQSGSHGSGPANASGPPGDSETVAAAPHQGEPSGPGEAAQPTAPQPHEPRSEDSGFRSDEPDGQ